MLTRCLFVALAASALAVEARAATVGGTASVNDVQADVASLLSGLMSATAAYGSVAGNDTGSGNAALNLLNDSGSDVFNLDLDWTLVGKSDDGGNGPFTSNPEVNDGALTFDTPMDGPFVISIKSSTYFSLYYFDDSFSGVSSLDFVTLGVAFNGNNGKGKDLSHASLFKADGLPSPGPTPGAVPTPAAFGAGLVLLGLGAMRRR